MKNANTTCDIYRSGASPPTSPNVAGVRCKLESAFAEGQRNASTGFTFIYTHTMTVPFETDIRDGYTGNQTYIGQDSVWIPDQNGTRFTVRFVEIVGRGTTNRVKRAYLDRQTPTWPSDNL